MQLELNCRRLFAVALFTGPRLTAPGTGSGGRPTCPLNVLLMPASAAFFVVAEDSSFIPCGVCLWTNVLFRIDSAIAPDRHSPAAERLDSSTDIRIECSDDSCFCSFSVVVPFPWLCFCCLFRGCAFSVVVHLEVYICGSSHEQR